VLWVHIVQQDKHKIFFGVKTEHTHMCTTEVPLALFCIQIKKIHSTVQDAKIHISEPRFSKDISIVMLIADFHYAPNDIRHHYLPRKTSITKGLSVPPQSL
jgi:hypothetical protein